MAKHTGVNGRTQPIESETPPTAGLVDQGTSGPVADGSERVSQRRFAETLEGGSNGSKDQTLDTPRSGETAGGADFDPLAVLRERLLKGADAPYGNPADPTASRFPALWQLLTQRVGKNGRQKQTASLRVEATPTGFRMTLSDLTLSVALTVEAHMLDDLLPTLERGIRDPRAPWRDLRVGERAQAVKSKNSKNRVDWE